MIQSLQDIFYDVETSLPFADVVEVVTDTITGQDIRAPGDSYPSFEWLRNTFRSRCSCPHCHTWSEQIHHEISDLDIERNEELFPGKFEVLSCPECTYWQIYFLQIWGPMNDPGIGNAVVERFLLSKLKTYEQSFPPGVAFELGSMLRRDDTLFHKIDPTCLEKFVADVYRANHKAAEAIHVGRPDDGGVDVIYVDDGENEWLIQVKRRQSPNKAEGVRTLRELLGAMVIKNRKFGAIVSTADHFSYQAIRDSKLAVSQGYKIELIDKGKLNRMIGSVLQDRPWLGLAASVSEQLNSDCLKNTSSPRMRQLTLFE